MSTPCDKCICMVCARNAYIAQSYHADNVTECVICSVCRALQIKATYAGDAMAAYTCTDFVRRNEPGGVDNDGTLPQQNATTRDA